MSTERKHINILEENVCHVVVDIETLGTIVKAPVIAIGAVAVDSLGKEIGSFEQVLKNPFTPVIAYGVFLEDQDTVAWWDNQEQEEAKEYLISKGEFPGAPTSIKGLLLDFFLWYGTLIQFSKLPVLIYGNGPTFDISILEYASSVVWPNKKVPWDFRSIRDIRTIDSMAPKYPSPK